MHILTSITQRKVCRNKPITAPQVAKSQRECRVVVANGANHLVVLKRLALKSLNH